MKKIALMHYAYPPNVGGVELLLQEHAKILNSFGYKVTVITGNGKSDNADIDLVEVEKIQSILRFDPGLYEKIVTKGIVDKDFFTLVGDIKGKIEKYLDEQDIIIIHNILSLIHNLPLNYYLKEYIKNNPQKKYIIWVHDQTFIDKGAIIDKKEGVELGVETRKILFEPIENAVYVTISETLKKLFSKVMKMPKDRIIVIPNGINIKSFLEIDNAIWEFAGKYKLLSRFPVVLSPVNILERKNIDYCIDVVKSLKEKYPDIAYIISGQPSKHRNTEKYLNRINLQISKNNLTDNVFFATKLIGKTLSNEEVRDLYNISDLVFYFTKGENFGLPVIESCLLKTPIFVSDLEVFHEIGGELMNYIDYKTVAPKEAAKKIIKMLESNEIVALSYKTRNKYNLETIIKEKLVPHF